jgi:putative ATP-dependent endonuclease of the OLD family
MCLAHSFLDHDDCGLKSSQRAQQEGLLLLSDVTFTTCEGMNESELEDLFEESVYSEMLRNRYGVSTHSPKFKGNAKWSDRLARTFKHQGKPWSDQIKGKVKADVAELIQSNSGAALNIHRRHSFDALVAALEEKLNAIRESKS